MKQKDVYLVLSKTKCDYGSLRIRGEKGVDGVDGVDIYNYTPNLMII